MRGFNSCFWELDTSSTLRTSLQKQELFYILNREGTIINFERKLGSRFGFVSPKSFGVE